MVNYFWNIYGWVYDAALLELIPYQNLLNLAGKALAPHKGGIYFDAGCGTGNLISNLNENNDDLSLIGADSSSVMLKRAIKKTAKRSSSITFHKLDLNSELPFSDNFFDGVTCINVLYILEQPELLIKEMQRVLKKNGRLIIATPLSEPKLVPVINEHVETVKANYPQKWLAIIVAQAVRIFIPAIITLILNLFITRNQKYLFFNEYDLRTLIENNGFQLKDLRITYGHQVMFMFAEKC